MPYSKVGANGSGTAIPLPATVLVQRRCPPDKVRPLPPTPGHSPCKFYIFIFIIGMSFIFHHITRLFHALNIENVMLCVQLEDTSMG